MCGKEEEGVRGDVDEEGVRGETGVPVEDADLGDINERGDMNESDEARKLMIREDLSSSPSSTLKSSSVWYSSVLLPFPETSAVMSSSPPLRPSPPEQQHTARHRRRSVC